MADFPIPPHGTICWRELRSRNLDAAKDFYQKMFGWEMSQSKTTEMEYSEINVDGHPVGGMMSMDGDDWGEIPSHWATYVAVDNTDATVELIAQKGGHIHVPPFDAKGVGRMAMVADPSGAAFAIIQFEQQ